jgi:hypothetical protein
MKTNKTSRSKSVQSPKGEKIKAIVPLQTRTKHAKLLSNALPAIAENFEKHLEEHLGITGLKLSSFTLNADSQNAMSGCVWVGKRLECGPKTL